MGNRRNKLVVKFEHQVVVAGVLGILVVGGLGLWADVGKVGGQLMTFDWRWMPVVLSLTLVNYALRSWRWRIFLRALGVEVESGVSRRIFLSGLAMTVTPGRLGELMKSYFLKKFVGVKVSRTAPVVVFERLTDGLAMLVLMSGGLVITHYGGLAVGVSLGLAVGFIWLLHQKRLVEAGLGWVLRLPLVSRTYGHLNHVYSSLQELVRWRVMLPGFFLSLGAWAAEGTGFFLIIRGLGEGLILTDWQVWQVAWFIFGFAAIVGFATLLPGGLGVAEGTITGLLVLLLGMTGDAAVVATILVRLSTLWLGVGVGVGAMMGLQKDIGRQKANESALT